MIRPATAADQDALMAISERLGLFDADELAEMVQMLAGYFTGASGLGHHWLTIDGRSGAPIAVAYYGPEPFAGDVHNLYLLGVLPEYQGEGLGKALVLHVEAAAREEGARILLIETSSLDALVSTRAFYSHLGYAEEACIRDYYAPGDDKVIFWKKLASDTKSG
jgi:ribosomal protein S18 acetylase RimI-like enzyme